MKNNALFCFVAVVITLFASCKEGLPLQHSPDCKFTSPKALAQSIALCLKDDDYTCAQSYLPGIGNVLKVQSTNEDDTDVDHFGEQADHLLVKAFKEEITNIRKEVAEKGGDITKLKLLEVSEKQNEAILKIEMHLEAGSVAFTIKPVGLFNSEGNWYILGSRFTTTFE